MPKQKETQKRETIKLPKEIVDLARKHARETGMTITNVFVWSVKSYVGIKGFDRPGA